MQVCKNCVMDTTDSKIIFDENGVCDHCNTFFRDIRPKWKKGNEAKNKLNEKISIIKSESKETDYDCIVGVSGGIDSSYLLYAIVEKFKLRPLVFHVDGGWNSQIAVNNIEKLIDGLNLDLFTEVINWEVMRELQLSFFKSGVPHIDAPQDHAFFASMYKFSSKFNVKNILTGGNFSTECIRNPIEWMYYQSDLIQLKDIYKTFTGKRLKDFPTTSILWHKVYLPYFKNIKVFRPLDLMDYNKEKAMSLLVKKFGYQKYSQKHFESRFTKFYESYWLPERFGYDTRKVQYSSLILTGQMTRDLAIKLLKKPSYDPDKIDIEFEYIANKLEIPIEELRHYFNSPHKTYKDYKSQQTLYMLGSKVLKKFGIEKGGKR